MVNLDFLPSNAILPLTACALGSDAKLVKQCEHLELKYPN